MSILVERSFLLSWITVLTVMVTVAFGMGYEITKLGFGPFTYTFSEPVPDIEKFRGNMQPVVGRDGWGIALWEGSDPTQDQWAMIGVLFERTKAGANGSIIFVQISTGVTSGDPDKMKLTTFVDLQLVGTGIPSYKLTRVESFENFGSLLVIMKAKHERKLEI